MGAWCRSKRAIGGNMFYKFICTNKNCGAEEEKEIAIKDYDEEKDKTDLFCLRWKNAKASGMERHCYKYKQ